MPADVHASLEDGRWRLAGPVADLDGSELIKLLGPLLEACRPDAPIDWWVEAADDTTDRAAVDLGLTCTRELLQMRCSLPTGLAYDLDTRPFRSGADDEAWLEVNNRAFEWHEEQGGWSREDLSTRLAEPWFDPAGFLLHEIEGRLAGFCWTRVHDETEPPLGEIFVIAVDPDFAGRGFGRALTLAGLDHLATADLAVGMLYVEADNGPALGLYRTLGFETHHIDRRYSSD